jgi:hypothetical protein
MEEMTDTPVILFPFSSFVSQLCKKQYHHLGLNSQ